MKFKKALKLLEEGKKLRLKTFAKDAYVFMDDTGNIRGSKLIDIDDDDWEIYEEPKSKKQVWQCQ